MVLLTTASLASPAPGVAYALIGSWQFDATKSSFSGAIPYQKASISFTRVKGGIKVVETIVEGNSRTLHFEYLDTLDGRVAPVIGNPFYDGESTQWPNSLTAIRSERRNGKATGTTSMIVAQDLQTYTAHASRTLPNGSLYTSTIAWRRVSK